MLRVFLQCASFHGWGSERLFVLPSYAIAIVQPQVDSLAQHVLAACLSDGPYSPLWDTEEDLTISFSVSLW